MKLAFIFPGQGSQFVGMGKDFYDKFQIAKDIFNEADGILGFPISKICFEGPEEELKQTKNTQPAIFLHSYVVWKLLQEAGKIENNFIVAGHSLGEYSALLAINAINFGEALKLVRLRGELMQKAGEDFPGTMAAIVGLEQSEVEKICAESEDAGVVKPANFNSPGQIVISGSVQGVTKAMTLAKSSGAKLVRQLVVSGAFHSPLMQSAKDKLAAHLKNLNINSTTNKIYANVTASPVADSQTIRELLIEQVTKPVRWEETIKNMAASGVEKFIEVGPGNVLQNLVKRSVNIPAISIGKVAELESTIF